MRLSAKNSSPAAESQVGLTAQAYHRKHRLRRAVVWLGLGVVLICLLIAGGIFFKSWWALHHVLAEHTGVESAALKSQANVDPELSALTEEGGGRINILLLGVGDSGHAGATLSDTILVASIEPKLKQVALLSIPRDLFVPIPGHGTDKINAAHSYGESQKRGGGPDLAKTVVGTVLGVPIHNYIRVDFSAFKQGVNALGGVSVNVPNYLSDPEYPCDRDEYYACGFSIKAGQQVLKGDVALKYVRCRKGNCGDDFGRAARQQQVLIAMREKALSLSTLTNPAKLSSLIDTAGNNAKTDLSLTDLQNLAGIIKDIPASSVTNTVLNNEADGLVMTANIGGDSVVIPKLGSGKFSDIQALAHKLFADRYIVSEHAKVVIHNASGKSAIGTAVANLLKSYNYTVVTSDDVATQASTQLVDQRGNATKYTRTYLEKRFKLTASSVPSDNTSSDLVLTLGQDYGAAH